jgi:hypothetical protein
MPRLTSPLAASARHGLADTEAVDAMTGMVLALTWAGQPARGR